MQEYEIRREDGWKDFYGKDPAFEHGQSPTANVTSFFCKRRSNEPVITGKVAEIVEESVDFDTMVNVKWVEFHLNRVLKSKRTWYGDEDIYQFVVLVDYLKQCKEGNYRSCLLSWQEMYLLKPRVKK